MAESGAVWRSIAVSLWITPPLLLSPMLLPLLRPSSIRDALADQWQIYLLFFGLPFALGVAAWIRASRASRRS